MARSGHYRQRQGGHADPRLRQPWHGVARDRLVEYARLADVVVISAGPFARLAGMRRRITGDVPLLMVACAILIDFIK